MKIAQYPEPSQFEELMKGPKDTKVVMVNLLSFKDQADGGNEGMSGLESYRLYGDQMKKFVESKGGRFIWSGRVDSMVIGESDSDFDMIALVEYPSREAFVEIASSAHVREIGQDRAKGLAGQWLIATTGQEVEGASDDA
ncbi:MAG: hypothetical protein ABGX04_02695 [Myxococcales bacterium]